MSISMKTRIDLLIPLFACLAGAASAAEPVNLPKMPVIKPLFEYPVRDTAVCPVPDGMYYLIGTTGHPTWWNTNEGVRMWKSKDLKTWDAIGLVWSYEKNARMKDDMSGLAEPPRHLKPAGADQVGFEGAFITKINGRYHLICADFMNWDGKTKTYDCMAASSEKLFGPYGERYPAVPGGGHNMLFKDKQGKWWSTFFGNDDKTPFKERAAILRIDIAPNNRITPVVD